ncbi:MAG TPA: 4-demethylwyosine synthase TYW1 [Candidatus Nanoarchaeia archaeon]|nr:4-demethylwyosine synthase TYW1 [Candidatus Nanoarchaeia archaeon]
MKYKELKKRMQKQHYSFVGNHSAVQICRWTKKSIRGEGNCYKQQFYGIQSHRCCQMTPWLGCQNRCLHCWRPIELDFELEGGIDSPSKIINKCIEAQRKLLLGFKILPETKYKTKSKADMKKWQEAQEPMQFAISLSGEPTIYPRIGELIAELRKRGKTSFLVTNGLYPEKIKEIAREKQLPTQLYVSVNTPNKELYDKFHRSSEKDAWKKLNETLEIMPNLKGKTRTIFRMNLIRKINMDDKNIKEFAELIKKSKPLFIELKGYMSVGFARERLGYEMMPTSEEMLEFAKKLEKELKKEKYRILDSHEFSRAIVLGKNKSELKINKTEI